LLIHIRGTKTDAADRWVPVFPEMRVLLDRMQADRAARGESNLDGKLFSIRSAKKALAAACDALGIPRLTHHDLRDDFATTCIEAGVDIPTVAAWMGHADGGALLMKVYAHHRGAHSAKAAATVSFSNRDTGVSSFSLANAVLAAASAEMAKNGPKSHELEKLIAAAKALGVTNLVPYVQSVANGASTSSPELSAFPGTKTMNAS